MTVIDPPTSRTEPRWHGPIATLILIGFTLLAMGRLCGNEFTWWDDQDTVHQNGWLQPPTFQTLVHYATTPAFGIYMPLTYLVWAALALGAHVQKDELGIALNPWLFHTANVLCHVLAVLVVYRILRLLKADRFAAVCGGLLFGVHPLQVEAVAWVSGLKDVLSGLLALTALWQYTLFALHEGSEETNTFRSHSRFMLSASALLLAMLAKPSAMTMPLMALAIDRWAIGRPWNKVLPAVIGLGLVVLPLVVVARYVQDSDNTPMPPLWLRPLIACDALAFYLGKLIWPLGLIVDYGRTAAKVLARGWCYWDWIFPAGITVLVLLVKEKQRVFLAAWVIFIAGCLPVLGLTPAGFAFFSTTTDHYLYLSMSGPALALAWLLSVHRSLLFRLTACGVLGALIVLTIRQGNFWKNNMTLFLHDTEVNPDSYDGFINLGESFARERDLSRAVEAFKNAVCANPQYAMSWKELADALAESGRYDEAIAAGQRALELQIKYPNIRPAWRHDNELVGKLLFTRRRFAEAIPFLQTALKLEPGNSVLADELGEAQARAATNQAAATTRSSSSAPQ